MRFWAFLTASMLAIPSWAAPDATSPGQPVDVFRAQVADIARTAADPFASDASVWHKAQSFFSNVPGTVIHVEPSLRGWDFGRDSLGDGKEVSAEELVLEGRERRSDLKGSVPAPDQLRDAVAAASTMHDAGRLRIDPDGKMFAGQMGLYRYVKEAADSGVIELNQRMSQIAAVIGKAFAYATVAHEADHRVRHAQGKLSPDQVIEGEISAFTTQYHWLVDRDPHGERLPYARAALQNQIRLGRGGSLAVESLKYLDHLAEVRATGGDRDEVRRLIERLGYREGESHEHGGHEHAEAPTPPAAPLRS